MTWANKQKVGNPLGKLVLIMLANYADQYGVCFPSQKRIATDCECTDRAVREWLATFEKSGLIVRKERRRASGYRTSDEITLAIPELPEPSSAETDSLPEPDDTSQRNLVPGKTNRKENIRGKAIVFDPTEKWVKLDRQVDTELWLACERLQGKKAPTSDLHWKFPLSLVSRAKQEKAA